MKPSIFLSCTSPIIFKALSAYLDDSFKIVHEGDPSLKAAIFDHISLESMRKFHNYHPHAAVYLLLSSQAKIPTLPFPVKILERPVCLKTLKNHLLEPVITASTLTLNEFILYLTNRRLIHEDTTKNCILTEKETEILAYLYQAYPEAVTRENLLKNVWQYKEGVTTHTLETHLYKLKQKITLSSGGNLLKTTEAGYSLNL